MKHTGFLILALVALPLVIVGCSRQSPQPPAQTPAQSPLRTDQQIAGDVHAKLQAETALAGQNIQVAVTQGMVTLSGSASDPASRALAGYDAGSVPGVRTVVNNLTVAASSAVPPVHAPAPHPQPSARQQAAAPPPLPQTEQPAALAQNPGLQHDQGGRNGVESAPPIPPPASAPASQQPPAPQVAPPATPPPPAQPVEKTLTLSAGTMLPVRIVEDLSSATATPSMGFHATLAEDVVVANMIAIPQGTPVLGRVADVKDAAHFKGSALLSIELIRIDLPHRHIEIVTDPWTKQGEARGKGTAEKIGSGAAFGTIVGAMAGGGKGAAIGAMAGAGAGSAVNGVTRGQQIEIPSETLLSFALQAPITVTTSRSVGAPPPAQQQPDQPALQQRPQ